MPLVARLTLDPILRIATFLLVAVTAVLLGRLAWALIEPSSIVPAAGLTAVAKASESVAPTSQGGFRQLAALSVFGKSNQGSAVVNAPDTTLSWALKGVLTDPDPTRSSAILSPQGQPEKLYRVGASLPGNVRLEQIMSDRVILARDGKLETLRLKRAKTPTSSSVASRLPTVDPDATITPDGGVARIDKEAWASDPERFMDVVSVSPVMQDGVMYGMEVNPSRNAREFEAAGLQPGDVITSIEGTPVSEINDYRDILQELGDASSVSVSLERSGEPINITITME
ncbi:MAG TPA: type II secretion system protein GspC [Pseudomonas xinjiangensis]|uniref:Type II secretion system protein GspC n=2 Tax=root TaxID=1 RepID=A0A7V1FRD5_9GAMM|nr:type II secretion system protein GspC [Halopseudomonas xinjiangensis]HEC48027.1 type II secretion system protein GspC [Halopseudomonas xinjiangensis]